MFSLFFNVLGNSKGGRRWSRRTATPTDERKIMKLYEIHSYRGLYLALFGEESL